MEHISETQLASGYYKLVPDNGYRLYSANTGMYYSEAVTKNVNEFKAVKV